MPLLVMLWIVMNITNGRQERKLNTQDMVKMTKVSIEMVSVTISIVEIF